MQIPKKEFRPEEHFIPESVIRYKKEEVHVLVHRKEFRLYSLYVPFRRQEMVYLKYLFEEHWLEKAKFIRENVLWPSLEFVLDGSLIVETPEWKEPKIIKPGNLCWIPSLLKAELRTGPEGFCRKESVSIQGPLLSDWQKKTGFDHCRIFKKIDTKRFELLLENIRCLADRQSEETFRENGVTAWRILQFLQSPYPKQEVPARFLALREKMQNNLEQPLSLKELSREAQCSSIHLIREFRKYFGEPPYHMQRNMRMRHAANLLVQAPEISVKEIASQCGYENPLVFSAEFKRYHGESPRNFRKKIFLEIHNPKK